MSGLCGKGLQEGRKSAFSCHRKWGARGWGSARGRLGFAGAQRRLGREAAWETHLAVRA